MVDPLSYYRSSQCSTTGVTNAVVCAILSGIVHIKEPFLERIALVVAAGFLLLSELSFTICETSYNRKQNVLSVSLNKTFPSFLHCHP